jgi:hypothetical protein
MRSGARIAGVKAASLVLSLVVAASAPAGAASAAPAAPPPAAPPPVAAPTPAARPVVAPPPVVSPPLYGPPPGAEQPLAAPPAWPAQSWSGPPSEPRPAHLVASAAPAQEKSAFIAFSLSFSMPIAAVLVGAYVLPEEVGAVAILAAVTVGPSTGSFYAGRTGRGLATAATRLASGLLMLRVFDDSGGSSSDEGTILLGTAMFVTATLVDWIGAPRAVLMDNARARATVVPTVQSGGAGLSLVGSF